MGRGMGCGPSNSAQAVLDMAAPARATGPPARATAADVHELYALRSQIGAGGYAVVHLATRVSDGVRVAMKVMDMKQRSESERANVWYEIGLLAKLNDEHVIRLHEFFHERDESRGVDKVYMATEYLAGGDLLDAIANDGEYNEDMARGIFRRVLRGVKYLHEEGITHRDMKLENLLLGAKDDVSSVKICDLGLAKKAKDRLRGANAGTPQYAAPEVLASTPGDSSAHAAPVDAWACGVILYILLCGCAPFTPKIEDDDKELYELVKSSPVKFDQPVWAKLSPSARDLVLRLLDKDPRARLSAKEALEHAWMQADGGGGPTLKETQMELKKKYEGFFKRAGRKVASMMRLSGGRLSFSSGGGGSGKGSPTPRRTSVSSLTSSPEGVERTETPPLPAPAPAPAPA